MPTRTKSINEGLSHAMLVNQEACFTILMNSKDCLTGLHIVSYQFLSIYDGLVRIFNSSDDALLVTAKRQKF